MKIHVEIRNVYGVETVYPICDKAKLFAQISGKKTLTFNTIRDVKALGYAVWIKPLTLK